jgi:hypothetical protein
MRNWLKVDKRRFIPPVYRNNYLHALGKLRRQDPNAYIKMLSFARNFSATVVGDDMNLMQKHLEESNAYKNPIKRD